MRRLFIRHVLSAVFTASILAAFSASAKKPPPPEQVSAPVADPEADRRSFESIVEQVRIGARMVQAENLASGRGGGFPKRLDSQADGPCTRCFAFVTAEKLHDPRWTKQGNTYRFTSPGFTGAFTYDPATGGVESGR